LSRKVCSPFAKASAPSSARNLAFEDVGAGAVPSEASEALRVSGQDRLWFMERLRLVDELPVILERRYVVARHCPTLTEDALVTSLYRAWKEQYRLDIEGAEQSIRAVNLTREEAKALSTRQSTAGLLITSLGYLRGRIPLWFERTLYRGDAYEFHNRLLEVQNAALEPIGRFLLGS
jgi:GntR family transcriptional regulator